MRLRPSHLTWQSNSKIVEELPLFSKLEGSAYIAMKETTRLYSQLEKTCDKIQKGTCTIEPFKRDRILSKLQLKRQTLTYCISVNKFF